MAQLYELKNPFGDENISCYLEILNNKEYCIYFIVGSGEDRLVLFLSFGLISTNGNRLFLTDIRSKSELILEKRNNADLFVKKGFKLMCGKPFIFTGESSLSQESLLHIKEEIEARDVKVKEYLNSIDLKSVDLQIGIYKNGYVCLEINDKSNFRIYFFVERKIFLLSEGKWKKEGNKLELYDPYLDYSFLLLIGSRSLTSVCFPNEMNESEQYSFIGDDLYSFSVNKYVLSDISGLKCFETNQLERKVNIESVLLLTKNGNFCMSIDFPDHNPSIVNVFSYGSWVQEENTLFLTDIPSGFQIVLTKMDENSFVCEKGFYFFEKRLFRYKVNETIEREWFPVDFERGIQEREKREDIIKKEKSEDAISFQLGTYGHSLIMEVNNLYKLFMDTEIGIRLLLSAGLWTKDGNELRLYDSYLDYSFLLLIKYNDLLPIRYLDNDIDRTYLFPQKDQMYPFIMW